MTPIINNSSTTNTSISTKPNLGSFSWRNLAYGVLTIILLWFAWEKLGYQLAAKAGLFHYDTNSWYAIHLEDGNVFFGKIDRISSDKIILNEAYFLESFEPAKEPQKSLGESMQVESVPQKLYNLTERGTDKFFNTDHKIYINRDNVIFWEKLTTDSEIVKTIKKQK